MTSWQQVRPEGSREVVLFIEPGATSNRFHYNIVNDALLIDLEMFCKEIIQGYRIWRYKEKDNVVIKRNVAQSVQRYADGMKPLIVGVPVIS